MVPGTLAKLTLPAWVLVGCCLVDDSPPVTTPAPSAPAVTSPVDWKNVAELDRSKLFFSGLERHNETFVAQAFTTQFQDKQTPVFLRSTDAGRTWQYTILRGVNTLAGASDAGFLLTDPYGNSTVLLTKQTTLLQPLDTRLCAARPSRFNVVEWEAVAAVVRARRADAGCIPDGRFLAAQGAAFLYSLDVQTEKAVHVDLSSTWPVSVRWNTPIAHFSSRDVGVASFTDDRLVPNTQSRYAITRDGGKSWVNAGYVPQVADAAWSFQDGSAVVSGRRLPDQPYIVRIEANGRTQTTALPSGRVTSIAFGASGVGYAGGTTGVLYRSTNFGRSWANRTNLPGEIRDMAMVSDQDVVVLLVSQILRTQDGGNSWSPLL